MLYKDATTRLLKKSTTFFNKESVVKIDQFLFKNQIDISTPCCPLINGEIPRSGGIE